MGVNGGKSAVLATAEQHEGMRMLTRRELRELGFLDASARKEAKVSAIRRFADVSRSGPLDGWGEPDSYTLKVALFHSQSRGNYSLVFVPLSRGSPPHALLKRCPFAYSIVPRDGGPT
jgi:hypothetical protein